MKFKELNEMLQLKLKKTCRLNKELNGWLPSENDYVVVRAGNRTGSLKVEAIFSTGLEINFDDNEITSVNKF